MTLKQLAEKSGLANTTINNFENGKSQMSAESLRKLADSLTVSVEEILKEMPDPMDVEMRLREDETHYKVTGWEDVKMDNLEKYLKKNLPAPKDFERLPVLITFENIIRELINREKE